jgi:hypothetical protein
MTWLFAVIAAARCRLERVTALVAGLLLVASWTQVWLAATFQTTAGLNSNLMSSGTLFAA